MDELGYEIPQIHFIVTDPIVDVKQKVDIRIDDRLIQLKSSNADNVIKVARALEDRDCLGVSAQDVNKMYEHVRYLQREGIDAKPFVILLPAFDSDMVGNPFGIILDKEAKDTWLKIFLEDGQKCGFLPKRK